MFAVNLRKYAPKPLQLPEPPPTLRGRVELSRYKSDLRDWMALATAPPMVLSIPGVLEGLGDDTRVRTHPGQIVGPAFSAYDDTGCDIDLTLRPSAVVARHRLRLIVAADREACPAWRWVRQPYRSRTGSACGLLIAQMGLEVYGIRRRYRWERRR